MADENWDPYKEIAECQALLKSVKSEEKASVYIKMGDIYSRMNKKVKAQMLYSHAIESGISDMADIEKIAYSLYSSGESEKALQLVNESMNKAKSPIDKARLFSVGAYIDWQRSDYQSAKKKGDLALELLRNLGQPFEDVTRIRAESYNIVGSTLWEMGDIERSYEMYEKSLEQFKKIDDQRGIGRIYNNLGLSYLGKGEFQQAIEMFTNSFNIMKKVGGEDGGGTVLNNIGYVYLYMGDFEEAERNLKEGIRLCKGFGYIRSLNIAHKNLADLFTYKGEPIKAKKWAELAIEESKALKNVAREARAYGAMAMALQASGDIEEAERMAEKAVIMTKSFSNPDLKAIAYRILGAIKMDLGKLDEALNILRKSIETEKQVGDIIVIRSCQLEYAIALKAKGDPKAAEKLAIKVREFFGKWKDHFYIDRLVEHGL